MFKGLLFPFFAVESRSLAAVAAFVDSGHSADSVGSADPIYEKVFSSLTASALVPHLLICH